MAQVIVGENEGIESALRRFRREVSKAGIFPDMKKKRYFETPAQKRDRKAAAPSQTEQGSLDFLFLILGLSVDLNLENSFNCPIVVNLYQIRAIGG
jgi:small subunit ribosomal protein S21